MGRISKEGEEEKEKKFRVVPELSLLFWQVGKLVPKEREMLREHPAHPPIHIAWTKREGALEIKRVVCVLGARGSHKWTAAKNNE